LTLQPLSNSFSNTFNFSDWNIGSSITGLTIGKSSNISDININKVLPISGPITLYGANIDINETLNAINSGVNIHSSAAVIQTSNISATILSLQGSGTFVLNNTENSIENIIAGTATQTTGSVSFTNKKGLTIGDGTYGILSSGIIQVGTLSGNLTISNTISTTNDSDSAIKIYADQGEPTDSEGQGNILIRGTPTISSNGRASLYSGKPFSSTGLLALVNPLNVRVGVDSSTTTFDPILTKGLYALFRTGPEINFTENFNSFSISSGIASLPQTFVLSATGLTTNVILTPPIDYELSLNGNSYSNSLTLTESSGSLSSTTVYVRVKSDASGYPAGTMSLTTVGGTLKGIDLNSVSNPPTDITDGTSSTYADTTITFGDSDIHLTPTSSNTADYTFTSSDSSVASITTTSTNTAAIRNLKEGSAIITISQGADANYQAKTLSYTLTVNPLTVTLTPTLSQSKVYGDADPSLSYTSSPAVGTSLSNGETIAFSGTLTRTAGEDAGTYSITIGTLTNTNYTLSYTPADFNITAKPITIIPTTGQSKTYGLADATLSYTISPSTLPDGTAISLGGTLSRTTGENVGTYSITIGTVSDTNYNISLSPETFAINKKTVTVSGITARDKVYDGTTTSTLDLSSINFDSLSFSDTITATVTGTFDTKNIGTGKTVTLSASYSSTALDNYTIIPQTTTTASITARTVSVTGDIGIDKTFDNTTNLPLGAIGYGSLTGVLTGEDVALSGVGVYDAVTAGSRNIVIGTVTLTGADKDNYALNWTNGSGTIAKKTLTVTANNDAKFVTESDTSGYNGVSYTGFEGDDSISDINTSGLSISRTNSTTNTAAGTYPGTLVPSGVTATNYDISYVNGDYTIIPADKLLLKVSNQTTTYGTAATYSITSAQYYKTGTGPGTGLINLSVPTPSAGVYPINDGASTINIEIVPDSPVNSSAGKLIVGSYGLTANVVSGSSGNFSSNIEVIGNHSVAKQSLTASASSVSKEYDATTAMAGVRLSLATLETGDIVTVNGTGSFSSPLVGTGLSYTIAGLSLSGIDANNYYLSAGASFSGNNGVITKAPLTVTANNDNGVDTDPAYSGGNGVTYQGFKGSDGISDLGGTLTYTGSSQGATAEGIYAIEPTGITSSNYSITFVAGTLTIIVGDSDGDGVRDPSDNCPTTPNADQADTDGDGVGDVCDNAPNTPNADQADTDADGIGDVADTDDDNDGCLDTSDAFPLDPSECSDNDGDGIGDNADPDDDNDSILDSIDNCPTTPNTDQKDTDGDGTGDVCDNDTDNDGMTDDQEAACGTDPLDATDTPIDTDSDGIPDCIDTDKDNDGYQDINDAFPLDKEEHLDTDADGIGNNADTDDDNDGQSDEEEVFCGTDPLDATSFSGDVDNDGITDCRDQDNDNDGVNDAQDAFPLDPSEWTDTDLDGIGNNADQDDDNDGFSDLDELECNSDPLDKEDLPADLDGDGIPDCKDIDIDGDGCINTQDVFPRDPSECLDTDGDGLGNNVDVDDDNDGVIDQDDAFPQDPSESKDADGDGIGDNTDTDDNNDGFDDEKVVISGLLTPNSSGMESTWKIVNIDQYPQARVSVYDKNGLEVFSAQNYRNDWKGTYKNSQNPLPAGSYIYRINLGDGSEPMQGWIYISY
jgi:gliding motility-associated-like protein